MPSSITAVDVSLAIAGLYLIKRIATPKPPGPSPPGPKGLPLLGNLLDMPTEQEWVKFSKWGETYGKFYPMPQQYIQRISEGNIIGDICSVNVLGQPVIILNSAKIAMDLLDKKSLIYSD